MELAGQFNWQLTALMSRCCGWQERDQTATCYPTPPGEGINPRAQWRRTTWWGLVTPKANPNEWALIGRLIAVRIDGELHDQAHQKSSTSR
jgi:hypothetical protein